ncbi:MAG: Ferric siderophore transport system, periplasmic binding protein TonB [Myxococcaceae bacterium]|nr:Ferric siderophore transport system, periplasmic binding protein TonB [Myxococcaceae bacterium]
MSAVGFLLLSLAVHTGSFTALGLVRIDDMPLADETVEVSLVQEPPEPEPEPVAAPEPEPPAPEPEPVKAPPPRVVERAPKPPKEPPPVAAKAAPAAVEETLADFTGTTLTGQGGWASAVGNGAAMNGPIGSSTGVNTGRTRAGTTGGVVGGTGLRIVPEGELSRKVKPPGADILNAALERSYPKAARQQGIEGVARIRLRVMPSGKLQPLNTLSETYAGFGDACKASLKDISFEPALDKSGQPCATDIPYVCRFTVQ